MTVLPPTLEGSSPRILLRSPRSSILRRIVWQSVVMSGVTILMLSTLSFFTARSITTQQQLFEHLSAVATLKRDATEKSLQDFREHTASLARQIPHASPQEMLRAIEKNLDRLRFYPEGISIFDSKQRVIASKGANIPSLFASDKGTTILPLVDRKHGWDGIAVYAPFRNNGDPISGYLAVRYSVDSIVHDLFSDISANFGDTAEMLLVREQGGEIFVVHNSRPNEPLRSFSIGDINEGYLTDTPVAHAAQGKEAVEVTHDERGRTVVSAYRTLPSVGWGLVLQVASREMFAKIIRLGLFLLFISFVVLVFSGVLGFFSARSLTAPLLHLIEKVRKLQPGYWVFQRSVRTGDEVEMLDEVIADLTGRLKKTYETLEAEVQERTQELRRQFALDSAILESIAYGIFAVDSQGRITAANTVGAKLLGFERKDLIGRSALDVLHVHRQNADISDDDHPVTRCLRTREVFRASPTMHLSLARQNQTMLPVMLTVNPLLQDSQLLGAIVVFLDTTEERQTDYMKSEFISLASHQLRTPLSALRWYLELLGDESSHLTPEQQSYLDELNQATRRMANLLDTLLRVARLDDQGMFIERKDIDIVETMQRIAEEQQVGMRDAQISLMAKLPRHSITLSTDPILLSIVIQNLVSNATKYSPRGTSVEMSLEETKDEVKISVSDHGMGIPASEQKRVFEKFYRGKNIRSLQAEGSGLGLYLSKRIMENLGGNISFVSTEGKGTAFTVVVPKV